MLILIVGTQDLSHLSGGLLAAGLDHGGDQGVRVLGLGGQDGGVPDLDGDGCLEGGAGGDDLHQPGLEGLVEGVLVNLLLVGVSWGQADVLAGLLGGLDQLGELPLELGGQELSHHGVLLVHHFEFVVVRFFVSGEKFV